MAARARIGKRKAPPGRPRDERATRAILDVTLRHFGKYGYSGLSLDAVAAEAGVTKPALYRRWASKEDLVTAAVSEWRNRSMPRVTEDFEHDLEANLRQLGQVVREPAGMAMIAALLLRDHKQPALSKLYRERNVAPRRDALRRILMQAQREGALEPDLDIDTIIAMVIGAYHSPLILGQPIPSKWPREILKVVFRRKQRGNE